MTEEPRPMIKSQNTKPCGCVITEMSDGTMQMSPCVPCGLMEVARAMGSIGQIIAAVATRIQMGRDKGSPD